MSAGIVAAILLALERLPRVRFRPMPLFRAHVGTDLVYLLTGYVAGGALALAGVTHAAALLGRDWSAVPASLQVATALVGLDLGNYAAHWALHRFDVLWRFHAAHHSSLALDALATFRSHLVEQALRRLVAPAALLAAGMPAAPIGVAATIFLGWAILNHANVRLPLAWAEGVLVTPRLHRLHHVPATTERNLGTVFSLWDRLLGRLVRGEPSADVRFGLPRDRDVYPQTWARQLVEPFRRDGALG